MIENDERTARAVADVHNEDVTAARHLIHRAISEAQESWLPADAVLEALAGELARFAAERGSTAQTARYLQTLAACFCQQNPVFIPDNTDIQWPP